MTKEYIKLQNSNVTQTSTGHIKSEWTVVANGTSAMLGTFPSSVSEDLMFHIMDFSKEYELTAFNEGIKLGKSKTVDMYNPRILVLENKLKLMSEENERLSEVLRKEMLRDTNDE